MAPIRLYEQFVAEIKKEAETIHNLKWKNKNGKANERSSLEIENTPVSIRVFDAR